MIALMQEVPLKAAPDAGAEVRRGVAVRDVKPGAPASIMFEQDGRAEESRARLVIGADGRASLVRKWAGSSVNQDPPQRLIAGILFKSRQKEHFANLKAERYWALRQRFERNEISGLSDEMLGELAAINYLIDPRGRTAIEDKASVRSAIGRSPDLAEALMLALGEGPYPMPLITLAPPLPGSTSWVLSSRRGRNDPWGSCQAMDDWEDSQGEGFTWLTIGPGQTKQMPWPRGRGRRSAY